MRSGSARGSLAPGRRAGVAGAGVGARGSLAPGSARGEARGWSERRVRARLLSAGSLFVANSGSSDWAVGGSWRVARRDPARAGSAGPGGRVWACSGPVEVSWCGTARWRLGRAGRAGRSAGVAGHRIGQLL